jgi:hypothetical protein
MDNSQLTPAERKATCEALQVGNSIVSLPGDNGRYIELARPSWWGTDAAPPDTIT